MGRLSNTSLNYGQLDKSNHSLIYPNPCKDEIYIQSILTSEKSIISIYNAAGDLILQNVGVTTIQTKSLKSGLYVLQIVDNGISQTIRFVKE